MLLPQDDAKYKYCPLLKDQQDKLRFCLGAACMMWRWEKGEAEGDDPRGYCGLAGTPIGMIA
jgi:hypothetical protein